MSERRELGDGSGRTALVDGSVVNGYVLSFLAHGGMSCVYRSQREGQDVVLKEVPANNTREVPSLISEKNLLERLSHPNVVGFHTFFNEGGYYYLVLDYVPGRPLSDLLQAPEAPAFERVVDWGIQLCDIFTYLHAQNPPVIYRDLKAENIVLHEEEIKLIDFGIARLHKGVRKKDTELMGSPVTASPEHYGGAETDARSDIYTLGATLYELLTQGRRKQVGAFQFAPVTELNPNVSLEVEKVIDKATTFKPDDRFQTAREMRDALLRAVGRPIPRVPTDNLHLEEQSPKKRSPLALLALFGIFGLIALSLVKGSGTSNRRTPPTEFEVPSLGTYEASLSIDIFRAGKFEESSVVFLGEDIGLFQVVSSGGVEADARGRELAKRMNTRYHSACVECGGTGLEAQDIKVGRHLESNEIVVFYAHMHGEKLHWGPDLIATVTQNQAEFFGVTPRFVASYWRDLIKDTVNLSRGFELPESVMGPELSRALLKAREKIGKDEDQLRNLKTIIEEVTGKESLRLRDLFLAIPERKPEPDNFPEIEGYKPLTL